MNIEEILKYISVENRQRRNKIIKMLVYHNIAYDFETSNPREYANIIVRNNMYQNPNMKILISAHYDAVPKSKGANDNGAAVATLIKLAEYAKTHISYCPLDIAFFDREESGFYGSAGYVYEHIKEHKTQPIFFINCDVIGSGDGIVMVKHDNDKSYPTASSIITPDFMEKYNITEYPYFPPSDAYNLSTRAKFNGLEFAVFPYEDIKRKSANEVMKYMHNRKYDDISYINYNMVENVYNAIIDLVFVK